MIFPHTTFHSTPSRSAYHFACCSSATSAAKISRAFLCTFLCYQPYRFLCRGGIHAARPSFLESPHAIFHRPVRAGHARPLPHVFFHAPAPTHFINIPLQPPRSKNAPQGYFSVRDTKRPARTVLVPDGAPVRNVPGNSNKKYPATSCEVSLWCTIGDSNPGPTD